MQSKKISKRNMGKTARRLLQYIGRSNQLRLLFVFLCIILSALAGVSASLFLQTLIDDYVLPMLASGEPNFTPLLFALLRMAVILYGGVVANYLYNFFMATISQSVLKRIRDDMFSHMQSLPIRYFDTHAHGDLMSLYTNDTDTLRQMISVAIPNIISAVVTMVSVFFSMLYIDLYLTLFVIVFVGFMMFLSGKIGRYSSRYFMQQQASLGKTNGYIEEMLAGQKVVKVFCYEEEAKEKFDQYNEELRESATRAHTLANMLMPIMVNLGTLQYVLLAILGGALAINGIGGLTLGGIAAFLQLSRSFTGPLSQVAQQYNSIIMALAGAERIFKLMDEQPELDAGLVTLVHTQVDEAGQVIEASHRTGEWAWKCPQPDGSVRYTPLLGDVRFQNLDFGYTEESQVLHDITLYAQPGEKVAFVGATGAGKTTITNLINRFYDIQAGNIYYDGIDIHTIGKADLRRSLGVVLQDTHLFSGTILENIRYGRLDATDEEVYAAAKLANAHDFITRMPYGYDTTLSGDGAELSQGQRQLLSIARAAVADPPVLILDEATSSIDTRTELIVQKGMDALMHGRTVFVIAHRLSTIKNSDVIMVLDHGKIIERGNHEKLMAQKGRYYQLYIGVFELE